MGKAGFRKGLWLESRQFNLSLFSCPVRLKTPLHEDLELLLSLSSGPQDMAHGKSPAQSVVSEQQTLGGIPARAPADRRETGRAGPAGRRAAGSPVGTEVTCVCHQHCRVAPETIPQLQQLLGVWDDLGLPFTLETGSIRLAL